MIPAMTPAAQPPPPEPGHSAGPRPCAEAPHSSEELRASHTLQDEPIGWKASLVCRFTHSLPTFSLTITLFK